MPSVFYAQPSLVSSHFTPYNLTPSGLCAVSIMGGSSEISARLQATIKDKSGIELMSVRTSQFQLSKGPMSTASIRLQFESISYGTHPIADYIRHHNRLPSGNFIYSIELKATDGTTDYLSDNIESNTSTFISLILPFDKDTLDLIRPVFVWSHTEPFEILQHDEMFRLQVAKVGIGQSLDGALSINAPVFQQDNLKTHTVQFPIDAPDIEFGQRYAWQIQKLSRGAITDKSEVWEFYLGRGQIPTGQFVEMTPKLNVTPYVVQNQKMFIQYLDEYNSGISAIVETEAGDIVQVDPVPFFENAVNAESAAPVPNRFVINLESTGLTSGIHVLKLSNSKGEFSVLKFQIN